MSDMQRTTYCEAAMAIMEEYSLPKLARVVDCAIGLWDFENDTCRSFDWLMDYVQDPTNLPLHADRHAGAGADPITSLGALNFTGNPTLNNGVDLLCATAFGTGLFSAATPGGDARLGRNIYQYADDAYSVHYLYRFNGTWAAKTKVLSGQNLAWIGFGGYHGGGGFVAGAWIGVVAKGDYDAVNDIPTELQFWTAPDGAGSRKVATLTADGVLDVLNGFSAGGTAGWSGNWVNAAGDTVTVVNGIITDVS